MGKKPKKCVITVDDYAVIHAQVCTRETIDWFRELEIREKILRDNPGLREDSSEYEHRLWLECLDRWELKRDPIDNRLHIYRHDRWIEYKIAICYCFEGKIFNKIIKCQWNGTGIPKGCKLDVCFYDNNPEELQWIQEHHDSIIKKLQQCLFADKYEVYILDNIENQKF